MADLEATYRSRISFPSRILPRYLSMRAARVFDRLSLEKYMA